jgi:hypothetical protein
VEERSRAPVDLTLQPRRISSGVQLSVFAGSISIEVCPHCAWSSFSSNHLRIESWKTSWPSNVRTSDATLGPVELLCGHCCPNATAAVQVLKVNKHIHISAGITDLFVFFTSILYAQSFQSSTIAAYYSPSIHLSRIGSGSFVLLHERLIRRRRRFTTRLNSRLTGSAGRQP